ncbi:MAG: DUF438 domain-containing protein [Candidatus Pelethousia sp.]|nr:DUF438 domain-containing protein [Candidatus Pelethousia sp.]
MSKEINNREYRQQVLRELIGQLHEGKSVEEVKGRFEAVFGGVSAEEIALAEQALINGGLPVAEVQRLCDVHASVFKGSIEDIHKQSTPASLPGHPVNILKQENRAIEEVSRQIRTRLNLLPDPQAAKEAAAGLARLSEIDKHYLKKENLFFPYMEQYGITAPPKVMWGVDDEIRAQLKEVIAWGDADLEANRQAIEAVLNKIGEMIFKEENIMLPMLLENLTEDEWRRIADESGELGYCLIEPAAASQMAEPQEQTQEARSVRLPGEVILPTGSFSTEELIGVLNTLPMDITFVDKDDKVKYFSQGVERVFPRTKAVIGRNVSNCHPPASVHIVEKLVEDFKAGRKESEDFWIQMGEKYILIRYFAVRGEGGEYLGVLEVTQNIRPIQAIQGEKRLASE